MPARLYHLRFQGPPFIPHSLDLCAPAAAPGTRETSGEGKEGTETVAPTHQKVVLRVLSRNSKGSPLSSSWGKEVCSLHSWLKSVVSLPNL